MGQPVQHKMVIPSQLSEIAAVIETIVAQVARFPYDEKTHFAIRLVLEEALANAIRHGNRSDPSKKVVIQYAVDADDIQITIADEGPGFHPEKVPDPTLDENLTRPCGRGVLLMRTYMDEVNYNAQGNCVTMVRHRHGKLSSC